MPLIALATVLFHYGLCQSRDSLVISMGTMSLPLIGFVVVSFEFRILCWLYTRQRKWLSIV